MSLKRESRRGSTWTLANPFSSKAVIPKELRSIIDEVTGIKKVCMVARSSLLNLMDLDGEEEKSGFYKTGESLMTIEKEFKETGDVPLKDVVVASNAIFKKMASEQVQYEEDLKAYLGSDSALYSMIYKDFPHLQVQSLTNSSMPERQRGIPLKEKRA